MNHNKNLFLSPARRETLITSLLKAGLPDDLSYNLGSVETDLFVLDHRLARLTTEWSAMAIESLGAGPQRQRYLAGLCNALSLVLTTYNDEFMERNIADERLPKWSRSMLKADRAFTELEAKLGLCDEEEESFNEP
jgi:hypothetical protein